MSSIPTSTGAVLKISQDPAIVTVTERFGVPEERQDETVTTAHQHIVGTWKSNPDFVTAVLLKSHISGNVSVYAQWKALKRVPSRSLRPHSSRSPRP